MRSTRFTASSAPSSPLSARRRRMRRGSPSRWKSLPAVERAVLILKPYRFASREYKPEKSVVKVGDVVIGGDGFVMMAGPCTVESEAQLMETARAVKAAGATVLRGGAYKPSTSPYSFQGMGEDGLKLLAQARAETGLPVITEVMHVGNIDLVCKYADILQIGTRNMQNYDLLIEVGKVKKPVMLKRGMSSKIEEWLQAAEYIIKGGNEAVMLCERGVRTFETYTRNTLDLSAVLAVRELSHLPVVVDPSQGTGRSSMVPAMCKAALAVGADGLLSGSPPEPRKGAERRRTVHHHPRLPNPHARTQRDWRGGRAKNVGEAGNETSFLWSLSGHR